MQFECNNKLLGFMKVLTFFDQLSCQLLVKIFYCGPVCPL